MLKIWYNASVMSKQKNPKLFNPDGSMKKRNQIPETVPERESRLFNPDGSMKKRDRTAESAASIRRRPAKAAAGVLLSVLAVGTASNGDGGGSVEAEASRPPAVRTVVIDADTPNVWDAVDDEARASGYVDKDGRKVTLDLRPYVDLALEMNSERDPAFNPGSLQVGDKIVIPDIPDRQQPQK